MTQPIRPRIQIDISHETYTTMNDILPSGMRQQILTPLIEDLMRILRALPENTRMVFLGGVASRKLGTRDLLRLAKEAPNGDD